MSKIRMLVNSGIKFLDLKIKKGFTILICSYNEVTYQIKDNKTSFIVDYFLNNQGRRKEFKDFNEVLNYIKLEDK